MSSFSSISNTNVSTPALTVLYEDNHLIAVYKPTGMLTQGDASGETSLLELTKAWLKQKYQKPGNVFLGLIHRLDRPASGVVLFAKTSKGASRLSEQFRARTVKKLYRCWVEGQIATAHGRLDQEMEFEEDGIRKLKKVSLIYQVRTQEARRTELLVELVTGRKHQIRRQFSELGHPLLGDSKYGAKSSLGQGIALFAYEISFDHPTRPDERVTVRLPEELCEIPA